MTEQQVIQLYRRYNKSLTKFAYDLTGNYDEAGDLAGAAWVQFLTGKITAEEYFWERMCRYVKWRVRDKAKHNRRAERIHGEQPDPETAHDPRAGDPRLDKVMQAAEYLPPKRKKIFEMRYVLGFDPIEIARLLGVTVDTVNVQCHRSIQFLRRTITS